MDLVDFSSSDLSSSDISSSFLPSNNYICYLLVSECSNKTYVGITNNLQRRIKQHNGSLSGGAKYTCSGKPWKVYGYVKGFGADKSSALKFEWRWKFLSKNGKGTPIERRLKCLENLMSQPNEFIKDFPNLELDWMIYL
jgi:predicted GIY-YIG superfamily endonuclease